MESNAIRTAQVFTFADVKEILLAAIENIDETQAYHSAELGRVVFAPVSAEEIASTVFCICRSHIATALNNEFNQLAGEN